jgi:hypothetical protein
MNIVAKQARITKFIWLLPVIAAAVIGAVQLSQPHALFGVQQYDDGAYIGGALQLLSGKMPYRNFVFVQPSGVLLILVPVAVSGHLTSLRLAVALSRCLTVLATVVDIAIASSIVRHRGVATTVAVGTVLAIYPATFSADRAFLIEPWLDLFILLGIKLLFTKDNFSSDKKVLFAGILIGFAGTLKAMAIVMAVVCLVVLIRHRKKMLNFFIGLLLGFGIPTLPFFLLAPSSYIHDVIVVQLIRNAATTTPILARLAFLLGTRQNGIGPVGISSMESLARLIAIGVAAILLIFMFLPIVFKKTHSLDVFILLSVLATGAAMMLPQIFYAHYGWYFIPFLAISLGLSLERSLKVIPYLKKRIRLSWSIDITTTLVAVTIVILAIRVAIGISAYSDQIISKAGDPGPDIASVVPSNTCVVSDAAILLITANRYDTSGNCPDLVDATGTWLALDPTHPERSHGSLNKELVTAWKDWFAQSSYVVLSKPHTFRIPWNNSLEKYFSNHFYLYKVKGAFIYKRR